MASKPNKKQTSAEIASIAGRILGSDKYGPDVKAVAASVVSQTRPSAPKAKKR